MPTPPIALTVSINPMTYVTGKKWKNIGPDRQEDILKQFVLNRLDAAQFIYKYCFELTEAKNVHLHAKIVLEDEGDEQCISSIQDEFFSLLPKMPKYLRSRCWYQVPEYDAAGWRGYMMKHGPIYPNPIKVEECLEEHPADNGSPRIPVPKYKLF